MGASHTSLVTRRKLPDGAALIIDSPAEWFPHFGHSFVAVFSGSFCRVGGFLYSISLVLLGRVPGHFPCAHVFCDLRVPPLFFAPLFQDQPRFPIHDCVLHPFVLSKERSLGCVVSSASS